MFGAALQKHSTGLQSTCLLAALLAPLFPCPPVVRQAVGGSWSGEITKLSWSPRAFHLKNFLTDEECEHIKSIVSTSSIVIHITYGSSCLQGCNRHRLSMPPTFRNCRLPVCVHVHILSHTPLQSQQSHDKLEASGVVDRATGATIPSRVS